MIISRLPSGGGEKHGATISVTTSESTLFGKSVSLIKNGVTVNTKSFDSNGRCSFVVQNSGTYTITSGEANKNVTVTSDNVLNKTIISVELSLIKIVAFATGTDEEIAKMVQAHYNNKINVADYWSVGDMRTVHLSAMNVGLGVSESHREQDVQFVIGDFEHDDLATPINGHTKAAVTILQKDCLMDANNASDPTSGLNNNENGYMNSTSNNTGGWNGCSRRGWCNNVYFASLPSEWQSMVKTVNKKTSIGRGQATIEVTKDKIFLAAEIEIFGSEGYSFAGEGTQYQYYKNAIANKYKLPKYTSNYSSNEYWLRSPNRSYNEFCIVVANGNRSAELAKEQLGIAPNLCI